ncbi:hypothetical protein K1719_033766 [Acacia pycnantha]|nr:hypothetical protein K1719_033766 [Acacia pycnantha]
MLFDHYLTVRPWEPQFNLFRATINKVAMWVRLPRVFLEYYDKEALAWIGDITGEDRNIVGEKPEEGRVGEQGGWKVVQKPKRQKKDGKEKGAGSSKQQPSGSRFSALAVESLLSDTLDKTPVVFGEVGKPTAVLPRKKKSTSALDSSDRTGVLEVGTTLSKETSGKTKGSKIRIEKGKSAAGEIRLEMAVGSNQRKEKRYRDRGQKSGGRNEPTLWKNGNDRLDIGLKGRFWESPYILEPDIDVDMIPESQAESLKEGKGNRGPIRKEEGGDGLDL